MILRIDSYAENVKVSHALCFSLLWDILIIVNIYFINNLIVRNT